MTRINSGIDPQYLTDSHLIAESVEITMVPGSLKYNNFQIKGKVPEHYTLGKGHVNFFKDKLAYLYLRLGRVNAEMVRRGFQPGTDFKLLEYPFDLIWGWIPTQPATYEVRLRIVDRIKNPKSGKPHRYMGKPIDDVDAFCIKLLNSPLYFL